VDASLQPLLRRLDQLPEQYAEIREGVRQAVLVAAIDPEMALTRCRKVLELMVRDVFERRVNEPAGTRPLENLLQRLVKDGHMPRRPAAFAHGVRELGNVGTHGIGERCTADDVHQALAQLLPVLEWYAGAEPPAAAAAPAADGAAAAPAPAPPPQRLAVIPKGLRSFDAADARFFLELLPGPRDEHGLPESLRFWKQRIEAADEGTFTVGVLYGPSGCGKSSLVKAGLLPRLADHVLSVYVEATADDTEARLLRGLRRRCPDLPGDLGLVESLLAVRKGPALPPGRKVLLVLDQFEQWLHARRGEANTALVQALRQCDGQRVQALVLVRDDFWLAVSRFFQQLEVPLVEGHDMALVDLFDPLHARKVLALFGRAYGRVADDPAAAPPEQERFLDQAVAGLAEDGKVVCVRLALFADMVKGKPWTAATLRELGGTEGVGVAFLEEAFAGPRGRPHQEAARAVLRALLPETGSDIKGNMQSHAKLLEASGYARRGRDFEELLRILDGELRLLTPAQPPEPDSPDGLAAAAPAEKYYQLTHDYLVPALREWLTRKQKQTWRGRAELRLAERAALWQAKPESRHLPAWWEWLDIRLLTRKKDWTAPQRKMMRKAGRLHALRAAALLVLLLLLGWGGYEGYGALRADYLVQSLITADTADVPGLVGQVSSYRRWANGRLLHHLQNSAEDSKEHLHASLALLPIDASQAEPLGDRLLAAKQPAEVKAIRTVLHEYAPDSATRFWPVLGNEGEDRSHRLRAACALAPFAADDTRWAAVGDQVVLSLGGESVAFLGEWAALLQPVRGQLVPHLVRRLVQADASAFPAFLAVLSVYPEEAVAELHVQLQRVAPATAKQEEKQLLAQEQAQAAVALLRLGQAGRVWPLFHQGADPTCRTYLIHRCAAQGVDPALLAGRLLGDEEPDPSARQGLLLALGGYGADQRAEVTRGPLVERLLRDYRDDPDPGVHSAAAWLLRRWELAEPLARIDRELVKASPGRPRGQVTKPRWEVNGQGQTFAVIPAPGAFEIGSPADEKGRLDNEERRRVQIDYSFAVALKLVTVAEFKKFRPGFKYDGGVSPSEDAPINSVSWYEAAAYCNWLSEQEHIDKDQWCYPPVAEIERAAKEELPLKLPANWRQRIGYRLPTEAEWEYACRAGTVTAWSHGSDEGMLGRYAWYYLNSNSTMHPVGTLKPNGLGLFDVHGNAWQWCHDRYAEPKEKEPGADREYIIDKDSSRLLRGGSFSVDAVVVRSARRIWNAPAGRYDFGFRPARTYR
jgi:formylglycine-generating enzyme required for sulfatase activity